MKKIMPVVVLFGLFSPSWADSPMAPITPAVSTASASVTPAASTAPATAPAAATTSAAPAAPAVPTTITSDVMELKNHGALTVFLGHVILDQLPYHVTANRMVQDRVSNVVDLYGNVVGTWSSIKGDRVLAVGERARYTPSTQILELWDHPKVTRWENDKDLQPMIITADRFLANQVAKTIWAQKNVHMVQGDRAESRSDEACYHTDLQVLDLGGQGRVFIHINDGRGKGDFYSDKAWMSLNPRHAQLIDHVVGHVIPAPR